MFFYLGTCQSESSLPDGKHDLNPRIAVTIPIENTDNATMQLSLNTYICLNSTYVCLCKYFISWSSHLRLRLFLIKIKYQLVQLNNPERKSPVPMNFGWFIASKWPYRTCKSRFSLPIFPDDYRWPIWKGLLPKKL